MSTDEEDLADGNLITPDLFDPPSVFQSKDEPEGTGKGKKMMAPFWVDL
jgi:hypothetical protein